MNPKLVASSCLFTIPAYYAYTSKVYGVAMLSIVSLVSSIINHVYCRQTIRNIDTILVNLIGAFYTVHAIVYYMRTSSVCFLVTIVCAICAIGLWYLNTRILKRDSDSVHAAIHVFATIGMVAYIRGLIYGRDKCDAI
jgi:hypothetical protein